MDRHFLLPPIDTVFEVVLEQSLHLPLCPITMQRRLSPCIDEVFAVSHESSLERLFRGSLPHNSFTVLYFDILDSLCRVGRGGDSGVSCTKHKKLLKMEIIAPFS